MDRIQVDYRVRSDASQVERLARYIAVEQTVEIPEELIDPDIQRRIVGVVESIRPIPEATGPKSALSTAPNGDSFEVTIGYNPELAGGQIPQLLNLIYGNVSIQKDIRMMDVRLPEIFLRRFKGPNLGISGVRKLLGVYGRPLLATALKPNGASIERLTAYARDFALGGGDIIKDDQNLIDPSPEAFRERVERCQEAIAEANAKSGRRTLYCPILTAPTEEIETRVEILLRLGIRGILAAPMLIGLDRMRQLAQKHGSLLVIAHPSLTGAFFSSASHGMEPGLLLGKLFRLLGADASIFPNVGGRFSFSWRDCAGIRDHLVAPWNQIAPALPMPAGGMRVENLPSLIEDYGEDAIFLIGGAILGRPEGVEKGTRNLLEAIQQQYPGKLEKPKEAVGAPIKS